MPQYSRYTDLARRLAGVPIHGPGTDTPDPDVSDAPILDEQSTAPYVHPGALPRLIPQAPAPSHPTEHAPRGHNMPRFNTLYDSLRTSSSAWRFIADVQASGSVAVTGAGLFTAAVTLPSAPVLRLSQFPGGTQLYLAVRSIGIAPSVATATGAISVYLTSGADTVPLAELSASSAYNAALTAILPTPITDTWSGGSQGPTLGTLNVLCQTGFTGTPTYYWRLGFSFVYLLPFAGNVAGALALPGVSFAEDHDDDE